MLIFDFFSWHVWCFHPAVDFNELMVAKYDALYPANLSLVQTGDKKACHVAATGQGLIPKKLSSRVNCLSPCRYPRNLHCLVTSREVSVAMWQETCLSCELLIPKNMIDSSGRGDKKIDEKRLKLFSFACRRFGLSARPVYCFDFFYPTYTPTFSARACVLAVQSPLLCNQVERVKK